MDRRRERLDLGFDAHAKENRGGCSTCFDASAVPSVELQRPVDVGTTEEQRLDSLVDEFMGMCALLGASSAKVYPNASDVPSAGHQPEGTHRASGATDGHSQLQVQVECCPMSPCCKDIRFAGKEESWDPPDANLDPNELVDGLPRHLHEAYLIDRYFDTYCEVFQRSLGIECDSIDSGLRSNSNRALLRSLEPPAENERAFAKALLAVVFDKLDKTGSILSRTENRSDWEKATSKTYSIAAKAFNWVTCGGSLERQALFRSGYKIKVWWWFWAPEEGWKCDRDPDAP